MKLRHAIAGCICLLFLGVLAGCGGEAETDKQGKATVEATVGETTVEATTPVAVSAGEPTVSEGPIQTIQVNETEMRLDPAEVTLDRPGTYVFRAVNSGNVTHALRIEGNGIDQATRNIEPGESDDLRVDLRAGTYEIDCPVDNHEDLGMRGTVTVREG